jgi:hypothetical protein
MYSAGRYHIFALCHWVDETYQGATALAGDFFDLAVLCSRPTVQVSGFSDGGVQCTGGRLIPGCLGESALAGILYRGAVITLP